MRRFTIPTHLRSPLPRRASRRRPLPRGAPPRGAPPRGALRMVVVLLSAAIVFSGPGAALGQQSTLIFDTNLPERAAPWHAGSLSSLGSGLFDLENRELPGLTHPHLLVIHDGELFVVDGVDGTKILVYSLADLSPLRSFGGDGEAPGQFKVRPGHRIGLHVTAERVVVTGGSKVSLFDRDGALLSEKAFPFWTRWDLKILGAGYAGEGADPEDYSYLLNLYDSELQPVREILRVANPVSAEDRSIRVLTTSLQSRVHEGEVYAWGHTADLVIDVFDTQGAPVRSLRPDYERVPVTDEIKGMILRAYAANPGFADRIEELRERIVFPDHLPAIWDCYLDGGKIYVLTYERQGWEFKMLVFDRDGNPLGNALLPVQLSPANTPYPATVYEGRWHQVVKNRETGTWELNVVAIEH